MQNKLVNTENIFKLVTKEDPNYIHKVLGCICMTNFLYQYYHVFFYGTTNLDNILGMYLITLHGILSISSLIFHIPSIRNRSSPMIYPEFRIHSIIFALRAVFCCYLTYFKFHFIYKIATCYITMICADIVIYNFNKDEKNGKTMRNMPFDSTISLNTQKEITKMHSIMQIGATTYMLGDIQSAFSPLLAIQLAAFLMTLVRKNIISSKSWHAIYSLTLWLNIFLYKTHSFGFILIHQTMMNNYVYIFFPRKLNKYISWTINFCLFIIYKKLQLDTVLNILLKI